ncbi:MAG: carboxypeptidase regulatory-like domain-containing protein [Candidatus Acidiferrum sp.]
MRLIRQIFVVGGCVLVLAIWVGVCLGWAAQAAPAAGAGQGAAAAQQSVASAAAQQAAGSVAGKVVLEGSGVGVRKVVVHLEGENLEVRQEYETATDALGNFRIEGVAAGEYGVTIQRLGFVPASGKQEEARVTVGAGQEVTGLVYKMLLTGVVAGKITEADGDPMQGVSVWVTRVGKNRTEFDSAGHNAGDAGQETTNDLGEYRIANLRAGQYIVQAQAHGMSPAPDPVDKGKPRERPIYALTYYPGTVEVKQASPVQVTAGVTATANFSLLASRSYRVSGTVTVAGNPRNVQMFLVSTTGQTEAQSLGEGGKFVFLNVLPGTYVAQIVDMSGAGEGGAPETHTQMIGSPIAVSEADVTGLVLQPEAGGSVKGKVRTEGGESLEWTNLNVSLVRVAEGEELPQMADLGALGGNSGLQEDGSFAVKDVAGGTYQVFLGGPVSVMQGYYLKSVLVGGREVVDTGFTVNGEMVLDVVLSAKSASIQGTVVDGDGKAVGGATVVTMPSTGPGAGRAGRMDLYVTGQADASGHFVLSGLVPGAYVVVGLAEVDGDSRKAEFFEKYGEKGTVVDVDEGERKEVEVVEE